MSTIIMSQCWPLQGMSPAQKAVLISLADNANDQGVCWPSVESIAVRTCLSERSVQNAIKWLTDAGALQVQQRQGRSTVYTVTPAAFAPPQEMRGANNDETPANNDRTPAAFAPPQEMRGANNDETPANNDRTPAAFAPTPAAAAPRTINEPSRNRKEPPKRRKEAEALVLPDWLDPEDWARWDRFRRKKSAKAWTDEAASLSLRTLTELRGAGHDPKKVIEQSIERGWTGLFELKKPIAGAAKHGNFANQNYRAGVRPDGSF